MSDKSHRCLIPARSIPVLGHWDVVVCGGGPAGCAAAMAAARHGARTLLVDKEGFLGGAVVTQTVAVILSTNGVDFQGVWHELMARLALTGGVYEDELRYVCTEVRAEFKGVVDPELVKHAWDGLVSEAGVELLHHAYISAAVVEEGLTCGVVAETRAGTRVIEARRVIDATGDGGVAASAGVGWDQGDGVHPWAMALTKVFRLGGVDAASHPVSEERSRQIDQAYDEAVGRGEFSEAVITESRRLAGYAKGWSWLLPRHRREMLSVLSRVLRVDPLDPFDLTHAEREGRRQALEAARFHQRHVPGCERAYLLDTSSQIGIRSSRRIHGLATATYHDALTFAKYADGVARSSWEIDVWPADSYTRSALLLEGTQELEAWHQGILRGEYFDIRYGALVTKGVDNLLVAGRCLSAEHQAEASLRIQQTCMATGQAAGTAAALSLAADRTPRELEPAEVVAALQEDRSRIEPAFALLRDIPIAAR